MIAFMFTLWQVLNACVSHKDWKCALWVLDEIRREKLHPNSASYGLAIEVHINLSYCAGIVYMY